MLEVILKDGEYLPEPNTDNTGNTKEFEPVNPAVTTTEHSEFDEETKNPEISENPGGATFIDVRTAWSDVPEKFWEIRFPEAVPMVNSLKRNLNTLVGYTSKNFRGKKFYIATVDSGAKLFKPLYNGDMLNDARRYRTEAIDAVCNTEIVVLDEYIAASILQDIKLSINADEEFADILCVPFSVQSELIKNGYLMNLKKVPFLNLNAEYYNASATEAFTVNGNIYGLVSDLTFEPSDIYAVFYNKTLIEQFNLTNPLETYRDGGWTYDSMFQISKELTASIADLNSDLRWSVGIDIENPDILNGLFISSGNKYFIKRDYLPPIMNFSNEKTLKLIDAVSKIIAPVDESGMENYLTEGEWNQNKAFSNVNVLFSVSKLSAIPEITASEFDWGILPVPALDAADITLGIKPYSFTDNNAFCLSVLKGSTNTEACGIVTGALSLASYGQLKDIYVNEQMRYYLRDVDSVKILEEIVNNVNFNQYNAFSTISDIQNSTAGILRDAIFKKDDFNNLYENGRNNLNEFFKNSGIFERN